MKFSCTILLSALAALVSAAGPNSFQVPPEGYLLHAGQSQTFTWNNLQGSTVTLKLRQGASGNLDDGTVLASGLQNTGSYTWNVPGDIVQGNSYTIEIIDEQDTSVTNYTPTFNVLSNVLASSSPAGPSSVPATTSVAAPTSSAAPATSSSAAASSSSAASTASAASTMSTAASASGSSASVSSNPSSTGSAGPAVSTAAAAGRVAAGAGAGLLAVGAAFAAAF